MCGFWRVDIMQKSLIFRLMQVIIASCVTISTIAGCSMNKEAEGQMTEKQMILDRLENAEKYYDMHPDFEKAFVFLRQSGLAELPADRYNIDGDRVFCMISKGPGRTRAEAKLEAHRKYIDIQYVIAGADDMGWKPTADCTLVDTAYNADKDIEFFNDKPENWTKVPAGSFVIFFPKDAHAPLVGSEEIHKAVLKIAVK